MMSTLSPALAADRGTRWVLLCSLAFNLFFVGAAGTLAARYYLARPAAPPAALDRSVGARIERLAATLPASDADILRGEFRDRAASVEAVQATYRQAQDRIRKALRAQPFEAEPLRAAMTETRAARQDFDRSLQEVIAAAAAKMSVAGRDRLADWPPRQRTGAEPSR
jgi:uncharacterized membrane protein